MKILSKNSLLIALVGFFVLGLGGANTALAGNPELPVDLGSAGNFRILAKTAVTTTGATSITGDIGLSPAAASFITGFSLVADPTNRFSTSALVTGKIYAADYAVPTPATMTTAVSDMETAYTNAAGRTIPDGTNLGTGVSDKDISGLTFTPGLYKWDNGVIISASGATTTDVTLAGSASDVWIFQIAGNLDVASGGSIPNGAKIILSGGAVASNVFWQVGGLTGATLGTYSTFKGNILSAKQVIMQTGAVLEGRALAQTQVTLDANTVSGPVASGPGTITVVKTVINDNGQLGTIATFPLFINGSSVVSGVTNNFAAGTYTVTETGADYYRGAFSGDCNGSGQVVLAAGENKFCVVTNDDVVPAGQVYVAPVVPPTPPLIDVVKVPSPLALPAGPGAVTYTYTLRNVGTVSATNITMVGDTCSPIVLVSGDTNADAKLDVNETWVYSCSTTLAKTHTNTVTATGWANGVSAVDVASATVIVGTPVIPSIIPPIIHITVVPSPLALRAEGGVVTYTKMVTNPGAVALSNVRITDDKCGTIRYILGDTNKDAKLDTSETWVYMCQANLTRSTTNIAQATGEANGLLARDLAITTVLVAAPSLPNTGYGDTEMGVKGLTRAVAIAAFHRSLGIGSEGKDVEALQTALEAKGLLTMPNGVAKGYFGNLTRKAVTKYQENTGLPMVGVFGPLTRTKIVSELPE
ncbi:MAG: hypothetical protein UW32_C0005G0015 [Candidatus Wolfebacteria bacterium GW2011_GWE2_44_13]|uniref:Uncharacterized protein n=1 Tax=Candidatus Wolfebacteria bacterium GW2011_GWE2_44_13 TaxID=1619017 RepID=A0A0G1K431_9BACT|nr:MAG: hypothetical protein UW32_C0005G0015 [Candidatus Wolfebacteria bacterium GW2011_GWE2_44_13]